MSVDRDARGEYDEIGADGVCEVLVLLVAAWLGLKESGWDNKAELLKRLIEESSD